MLDEELRDHYASVRISAEDERRMGGRIQAATGSGRRHRGGRGLAVAATAVAVMAGAIALAAVSTDRGHQGTARPADSLLASTPPTTSRTTSAAPLSASATPPSRQMSWQQAATTLTSLLRGWNVLHRSGRAWTNQTLVELVIDDGHGAAQIDLALTYPVSPRVANAPGAPGYGLPIGCKQDTESSYPDGACTVLGDGTQLQTSKGYEYPADPSRGGKEWLVHALRPNGLEVDLSEWNTPTEKGTPASRPDPPLTIAEMTSLVTSDSWTV
jgi:hypothetical protein